MIDKIKEELSVSNSLCIKIMIPSRNLTHFGKAHLNMLCIAFVFFCLMSTTQSLRHWEIKRENGLRETCCFCLAQDLQNGEHTIKECQAKFGNLEISGYVGPPICSCLSSKIYPKCLDDHTVCEKYIKCPNNRVYDSCIITELLTEKTMTCNDSLQWEHHIDCNKTCMPSHDIENGIAKCHLLGNKTVCNCTCKEGFVTSQVKDLSCIEAKQAVCTPEKKKQNVLKIALPIGIILLIIIIMIIIYYKWEKCRQLFCCGCCGNSPNDLLNRDPPNRIPQDRNSPNGDVPNGVPLVRIPLYRNSPNGNVPNGIGHISQESEQIPRHPVTNNTPGGSSPNGDLPNGNSPNGNVPNGIGHIYPVFNNTPEEEESILTSGDEESSHTPEDQDTNHTLQDPVFNNTPEAQESEQIPRHPVTNNKPGDEESIHTPEEPTSYQYDVGYPAFWPSDPESLRRQVETAQEETGQVETEMEPLLPQHENNLPLSQEETCKPNYE